MKISNNPKISIIIINYNGKKYLEKTLPAFLNLTYENKEIIIVDNGSIDGSVEFLEQQNSIHFIKSSKLREKNFACNIGIAAATWEYIFLCDNDLLITNIELLQELFNMYVTTKNIWILWISYKDEWNNTTNGYWAWFWTFFIKSRPVIEEKEIKKFHGSFIGFPHGIGFFMKKDIWNELGWYDDYLAFWWDDNDLWIRAWLYWYQNYIYTNSIQLHIWMQERIDTKKFVFKFKNQVYSELYVIVKNYRFFNMIKTLWFYTLYLILKSIKQSLQRKSILPFTAFLQGYYLFIKNLPMALQKRKQIQEKRKIWFDIFLAIK